MKIKIKISHLAFGVSVGLHLGSRLGLLRKVSGVLGDVLPDLQLPLQSLPSVLEFLFVA